MTCDLKSFSAYINELLEASLFQDVALNGLQVEGKSHIKRMATAVSASLNVIQKAVDIKADLLLTHHGLFLKGRDMVVTRTLRSKLKLLLQHDISLISHHLPLDAHREFGNNWAAARALGWTNLEPFGLMQGRYIGVKGRFPGVTREEFQEKLQVFYGQKAHWVNGGNEWVESAALISGGSYKSITAAAIEGVDCFITGNFDEPAWHDAKEEKINFYALGHAATEKIGVQMLGEHLHQKFGVAHTFIDEENPF